MACSSYPVSCSGTLGPDSVETERGTRMLRLLGRIRLPIKRTVVICSILLVMIASIFVDAPAQAQGIASLPESVGNPATVLGVATNAPSSLPGISWVRIGYITCGAGSLSGSKLKSTIQ